MQITELS